MATSVESLLANLNPAQREAVVHEGSPLLVLAGAGSGKTRVLAHRVAYLVCARGFDPGDLLAVTFTRKAAQEMGERIRSLLPEAEPRWWIGTFHALGARMLRRLAPRFGREANFVIYDEDDSFRLLKKILAGRRLACELAPAEAYRAIEAAKQEGVGAEAFAERGVGARDEAQAEVYAAYERELAAMNAFDFGDLLAKPVALFAADPAEREFYAGRFREVLVDEYQDTNRVQYLLVAALASRHGMVTVVGDDDQSIYAWRGADIRNILDFEADFPRARVVRLEENYRSTGVILEAAQGLIAHNEGRHEKGLWTRAQRGAPLTVVAAENEGAEARAVVSEIKRLVEEEGRRAGEAAILYRTNAQSRALEEALRWANLRYVLVGSVRFYERREVKDLLAYLRVIVNPRDEVSLRRAVSMPPRGIGPRTMERLAAWAGAHVVPLAEALERAPEVEGLGEAARARLVAFGRQLASWRGRLGEESAGSLARRVAEESGLWEHLVTDRAHEAEERQENVRELLASIEAYAEEAPEAGLGSYLEEIVLSADVDGWEAAGEAVNLMTLHNAKGLEFPLVFITGLEEGLLPHASSLGEGRRSLEEERRLLFVGITRARERVWLAAAAQRRRAGSVSEQSLSRFVGEIPATCLRFVERRAPVAPPAGRRRWTAERDEEPAAEPSFDEEDWTDPRRIGPGHWVRHPQWGRGRVLAREGAGQSLCFTIVFDGNLRKKVMARYARLELTGED